MMAGASGFVLTVRRAGALISSITPLFSITRYSPALDGCTSDMTSRGPVAPAIGIPFEVHWYFGRGSPPADTINVALPQASTVWLVGCCRMDKGTGPAVKPGEPTSLVFIMARNA